MAQDLEKQLLEMKKKVDEAKTQTDQTQGAIDQLFANFQTDFSVDSIEAGEKLLTRLEREDRLLTTEIEEVVAKLEGDYAWD